MNILKITFTSGKGMSILNRLLSHYTDAQRLFMALGLTLALHAVASII